MNNLTPEQRARVLDNMLPSSVKAILTKLDAAHTHTRPVWFATAPPNRAESPRRWYETTAPLPEPVPDPRVDLLEGVCLREGVVLTRSDVALLLSIADAVEPSKAARAEVERLTARVERVRVLADWHETKADKARRFRIEIDGRNPVMDKAAEVHADAARRLRRALDEEPQP